MLPNDVSVMHAILIYFLHLCKSMCSSDTFLEIYIVYVTKYMYLDHLEALASRT